MKKGPDESAILNRHIFKKLKSEIWNLCYDTKVTALLRLALSAPKIKNIKNTIRLFANFNSFLYLRTQNSKSDMEKEIANNMTSSMLIHPGEMIKDEIIARGITQKELAKQMGVSYTVFNEILNGKRPVTTEYALLLEAALGPNASIWIGLQADYNMQKAKQDKSFMKRLEKIRKIAAIFW